MDKLSKLMAMNNSKKPTRMLSRFNQGFSMVELIIVVSIVGIMATLGVVAFTRNSNEAKLNLASKTFTEYLRKAQIRSQQVVGTCTVMISHKDNVLRFGDLGYVLAMPVLRTAELNQDGSAQQVTCDGIEKLNLKETQRGFDSRDLKICGTSDLSNMSMKCDSANDGSDIDGKGNIKTKTFITFTPRGSASQGALIKFYSASAKRARCIAIMSPIGLIREGGSNDKGCDFTKE